MSRIIDLSNPYVLQESGANIEKVLGLPYGTVDLTDAQETQAKNNLGVVDQIVDAEPTEDSENLVASGGVYAWVLQQLANVKTLVGIAITSAPTKTDYLVGDTLALSGIAVTATYTDGSTEDVTSACTFEPATGDQLDVMGYQRVVATYNGQTAATEVVVSTPYIELYSDQPFSLQTYNNLKNWNGTLERSYNGTDWYEWDGVTVLNTTTMSHWKYRILLRGTNNTKISAYSSQYFAITATSSVYINGDIRMLLNYQNVAQASPVQSAFLNLFSTNTSIVDASQLLIPNATAVNEYYSLFEGCTGLINGPRLPAKSLTKACYKRMYYGCTSLAKAQDLPATTLAESCYEEMFHGCTALTKPARMAAANVAKRCYYQMYYGCTALDTLVELSALTLADSCYYEMFRNTACKTSLYQSAQYPYAFRVPKKGTGTTANNALYYMLAGTGGEWTANTPNINQTYFVQYEPLAAL